MKFSNGTEFKTFLPNVFQKQVYLLFFGITLPTCIRHIFPKAPGWISGVGGLIAVVGLIGLLFREVAARREWETKRKSETK
jgi:hypothetical protein